MADSVNIGLSHVYYAKLTEDSASALSYDTPVRMFGAISANINPNSSLATLFADDGPMVTAATIGEIELELVLAYASIAVQAVLLGHGTASAGIIVRKATDTPIWVALGFKTLTSSGTYKYVWLMKGKFSVPEMAAETKNDSVNFQTPTLNGRFVKTDYDSSYMKVADEGDPSWSAATGTNWFVTGPTI